MQIHQSAEDYLETILMLSQRMGRRWKRSAKAPCATMPPIRRQSDLSSKDTGTPKDVPVSFFV